VALYPDGAQIVQGDSEEGIVMAEVDLARMRAWRGQEERRDAARTPGKYQAINSRDHPIPLKP
jgi:hypothetical protein